MRLIVDNIEMFFVLMLGVLGASPTFSKTLSFYFRVCSGVWRHPHFLCYTTYLAKICYKTYEKSCIYGELLLPL